MTIIIGVIIILFIISIIKFASSSQYKEFKKDNPYPTSRNNYNTRIYMDGFYFAPFITDEKSIFYNRAFLLIFREPQKVFKAEIAKNDLLSMTVEDMQILYQQVLEDSSFLYLDDIGTYFIDDRGINIFFSNNEHFKIRITGIIENYKIHGLIWGFIPTSNSAPITTSILFQYIECK